MMMINYLQSHPTFIPTANEEYSKRDSFHVGKITEVNSDLTCSIKSVREGELTNVNAMISFDEKLIVGTNVLFKGSAGMHKSQVEILGKSPWMVEP